MSQNSIIFKLIFAIFFCAEILTAGDIRVAVASNFAECAKVLAVDFEKESGHEVVLAFGSTGKHYAQIVHGAPFDVFLAADAKRPQLLEKQDKALAGSRFTYALGRLVLWSPKLDFVDKGGAVLNSAKFRFLAVANPKLAPYGRAAEEILSGRGLLKKLRSKTVRGENIAQAYQYVLSGNAQLGFVAYSQVKNKKGSQWLAPENLYSPIDQQAVLLKESVAGRQFLSFLQSDKARKTILKCGYKLGGNKGEKDAQ